MNDTILVYVTAPDETEASKIARNLVEFKLAACVNIIPGVNSIYSWQGKICQDQEHLLVIKTQTGNFEAIRSRVKTLHSYDCPEIISVDIKDCDADYHKWLIESTKTE